MGKVFRNAEAERRIQERMFAAIARSHEKRIEKSIRAQYSAAARAVEKGQNIDTAIADNAAEGKIKDSLSGIMRDSYIQIGGRVRESLRSATGKSLKRSTAMDPEFERALDAYIETYMGQKITQISQATRDQIAQIVNAGIQEGLTLSEIAASIQADGKLFSKYRAFMIARTESHSAANSASLDQAVSTGVVKKKEWIAVMDQRTRSAHEGVASVVPSEPFAVGGESLMYPGDPSGSAGNIINCRCAMGYEV